MAGNGKDRHLEVLFPPRPIDIYFAMLDEDEKKMQDKLLEIDKNLKRIEIALQELVQLNNKK